MEARLHHHSTTSLIELNDRSESKTSYISHLTSKVDHQIAQEVGTVLLIHFLPHMSDISLIKYTPETTQRSGAGSPDPLQFPSQRRRKMLGVFLFSF